MLSGNPSSGKSAALQLSNRAVSTRFIVNEEPDRTLFLRNAIQGVTQFVSSRVAELYNSLYLTFSLDGFDLSTFCQYIWPSLSSGAALLIGEYVTGEASQYYHQSEDYAYLYKFILGSAILGYSALNRVTDKQFNSKAEFSLAFASEVMAITYLYSSVFNATSDLLCEHLAEDTSLVASLGTSVLLVPGGISYLVHKVQEELVRRQYSQGAQRSDTAAISSGLTPAANLYFQINHSLIPELMMSSRMFQLGLISFNILNAEQIVQRFRNLPALFADLAPATIKKLLAQQQKIREDFVNNQTKHQVLRFTHEGALFVSIPRYQLLTGDLVHCDASIDLASVPLSGEVLALQRDEQGRFLQEIQSQKFSVNLKAQNGEDVWIEHRTKTSLTSNYDKVELHAIRDGKQAGVLIGDQLNIYGKENIFIQIKPAKELLLTGGHEKKSVINQIISDRKQRSVLHSILASVAMAGLLKQDISLLPAESIRLMFTLFQTMIPFSESFLREAVNSRLLKKLNQDLGHYAFELIDVLRIVDFCNALNGEYKELFPQGVAIISDKTGTLTTNTMDVLGLWTSEMASDVQQLLGEGPSTLLPEYTRQRDAFQVFASAYTNNKKDMEPEEFALLEWFKRLLNNDQCLEVVTEGNNHFRKTIRYGDKEKELVTLHLGLFRRFGGRLTLVDEGENKYLTFCGVPKPDAFHDTSLLHAYASMQSRTGVLSRDWCLAQTLISNEHYATLRGLFSEDNKKGIEDFIIVNQELLHALQHYGTFIIDNPVKNGAERFIASCKGIQIPVFVATGDTTKAAKNIARVLCPVNAKRIIVIRSDQAMSSSDILNCPADATLVFSGINQGILSQFKKLMERNKEDWPVIIFAEMSTEGKGVLAQFLKENKFFVVANGDGTNDVLMMQHADMVIAHYSDDMTFAPGVGALVNLSDEQLHRLFGSKQSFYELFDIHQLQSLFVQLFAQVINTQQKPLATLVLKSGNLTKELASAVGAPNVKEMYQQHWFGVFYDLLWLWIASYEINVSADLPMDNRHIGVSSLMSQLTVAALVIAVFQAYVNYSLAQESTNLTSMILMLALLPVVLKSLFSGFKTVQDKLYPEPVQTAREVAQPVAPRSQGSVYKYLGTLFGFGGRHTESQTSSSANQLDIKS